MPGLAVGTHIDLSTLQRVSLKVQTDLVLCMPPCCASGVAGKTPARESQAVVTVELIGQTNGLRDRQKLRDFARAALVSGGWPEVCKFRKSSQVLIPRKATTLSPIGFHRERLRCIMGDVVQPLSRPSDLVVRARTMCDILGYNPD